MKKINNYVSNEIPKLCLNEYGRVQLQVAHDGETGSIILFPDDRKAQALIALTLLNEYVIEVTKAIDMSPGALLNGLFLADANKTRAVIDEMVASHFPKGKSED